MFYCPQCGAEYETEHDQGPQECIQCHVALRVGAPPAAADDSADNSKRSGKLVAVHVFKGGTAAMDAELARNWLESEGISCVLAGEYSAHLVPVLDCPLLVQEEDVEAATCVLKDYLESATALPDEEPG